MMIYVVLKCSEPYSHEGVEREVWGAFREEKRAFEYVARENPKGEANSLYLKYWFEVENTELE